MAWDAGGGEGETDTDGSAKRMMEGKRQCGREIKTQAFTYCNSHRADSSPSLHMHTHTDTQSVALSKMIKIPFGSEDILPAQAERNVLD